MPKVCFSQHCDNEMHDLTNDTSNKIALRRTYIFVSTSGAFGMPIYPVFSFFLLTLLRDGENLCKSIPA